MNTNLAHNVLNIIGLVIGVLLSVDWAGVGLDAETAARIAAGVLVADKVVKLAINVARDGVAGLAKKQPPVIDH